MSNCNTSDKKKKTHKKMKKLKNFNLTQESSVEDYWLKIQLALVLIFADGFSSLPLIKKKSCLSM